MEYLKINKTARIATHGSPDARTLWIALHGYGQLVPYFIRHFHHLNPETNRVIAPEGLHRFYLEGTSGRVGASWMTKEERERDIQDYIHYLDEVYQHYAKGVEKVVLLGFSQGVATASRWINLGRSHFDVLINWAGVFPPDLNNDQLEGIKKTRNFFVYGKQDPYFSTDQLNAMQQRFNDANVEVEIFNFEGKHQLDKKILTHIEKIIRS